jgi:zona occludens toxin (predicted ATPase)
MLVVLTVNVENYVLTILHDTTVTGGPSDACEVATTHVCKTAMQHNNVGAS